MKALLHWLEMMVTAIPLPLFEVWGRFAYILGFGLAIYAYSGKSFRLGEGFHLAREKQSWDAKAILSIPLTFVLVLVSGYVGSSIVLVPGAQTLESLKDLAVFACIVLFGYPALITVPFAYGLSDLIEGVPPGFLLSWLPGYFINPTCFWLAYQLFGKNPDFRLPGTWLRYLGFVVVFMSLEPVLWGYICAEQFTPEISYRAITPALFFTTAVTWILAPLSMLFALPLARRLRLFWAEIPGHVRERALFGEPQEWQAVAGEPQSDGDGPRLPIRMLILAPFIALVLLMVGATAFVTLRSASADADKLTARLHQEISTNIQSRLDDYLAAHADAAVDSAEISRLLEGLLSAAHGRAFIIDRSGRSVSASIDDPVVRSAVGALRQELGDLKQLASQLEFRFDHVTARPLSHETWFARAVPYRDPLRHHRDWILTTAIPEAYYLAGAKVGNSRSAMVFAVALLSSLGLAYVLASRVTAPLTQMSLATRSLAQGKPAVRAPRSSLEELDVLALSFNEMAEQLRASEKNLERLVAERTLALERSEKRTQTILDNLVDGVVTVDAAGLIQTFSHAAAKMFGYAPHEVIGQSVSRLFAEPDAIADVGSLAAHALVQRRELTGARKDGSRFPLELALGEFSIAEEQLFAAVVRDISAQKRSESDLREAKERADAASRAKSVFLANMSHEIRTPMNAILGFGQLLERDSDLSPRDRERLSKILTNGYHLLGVLDNVLEMSKIEAGRTEFRARTFDLHAALRDLDGMVRDRIEGKGLSFALCGVEELPRYVRSDAGKLRQILINLLSNATKFTARGGVELVCGARFAAKGTAELRIEVADTGIGIAPEEIARVFEPFEQTESGVAAQTGTGLGVAISRDFARVMGGELRVSSEPNVGTRFTLTLPVEIGDRSEVQESVAPPPRVIGLDAGQREPTILVVDDELDCRMLLRDFLSHVGIRVEEAADGLQALERFAKVKPDLVLMDVKMPKLDGVEATRRIRESERGGNVPVVMLSASVFHDDRTHVLRTGANEFIAKPFQEAQVWEALERHIGLKLVRKDSAPRSRTLLPALNREQVSVLGAELIAALREAVNSGYVQRVPELLTQARPEHAELTSTLAKLARDLEIQRLLDLL